MLFRSVVFGFISVLIFIFLIRQSRYLYDARLIYDNRILTIPSAINTIFYCENERILEETIISTFGILIGSKIYKWGCDGVEGSRLSNIEIGREWIKLTFGTGKEAICIELLHGITDKWIAMEITQKLWHETGVVANISSWKENFKSQEKGVII